MVLVAELLIDCHLSSHRRIIDVFRFLSRESLFKHRSHEPNLISIQLAFKLSFSASVSETVVQRVCTNLCDKEELVRSSFTDLSLLASSFVCDVQLHSSLRSATITGEQSTIDKLSSLFDILDTSTKETGSVPI